MLKKQFGNDYLYEIDDADRLMFATNVDQPTLEALKKAVERKEPTASYILASPLFSFLESDPDFQALRQQLIAQQNEVRTALAGVTL